MRASARSPSLSVTLLDLHMPITKSLIPSDPFVLEVGPASFNPIASYGSVPLLLEMGKILDGVGLRFRPLDGILRHHAEMMNEHRSVMPTENPAACARQKKSMSSQPP